MGFGGVWVAVGKKGGEQGGAWRLRAMKMFRPKQQKSMFRGNNGRCTNVILWSPPNDGNISGIFSFEIIINLSLAVSMLLLEKVNIVLCAFPGLAAAAQLSPALTLVKICGAPKAGPARKALKFTANKPKQIIPEFVTR